MQLLTKTINGTKIRRIADERARIDAEKYKVGTANFFNDRRYKEDCEWLTLAYLVDVLSSSGRQVPQFAEKLEGNGEPDFQTYLLPGVPFRRVEVTEVLRPDFRRGAFFRALEASGRVMYPEPRPHSRPWLSFAKVLSSKLKKPYSLNSWLVIYHDMGYSQFVDGQSWHERMLPHLRKWTFNSDETCDITRSQYEAIVVIDSSGTAAIRLHPHWDVVMELRS